MYRAKYSNVKREATVHARSIINEIEWGGLQQTQMNDGNSVQHNQPTPTAGVRSHVKNKLNTVKIFRRHFSGTRDALNELSNVMF